LSWNKEKLLLKYNIFFSQLNSYTALWSPYYRHKLSAKSPKLNIGGSDLKFLLMQVDDLINPPGRYMRPPKIVVIFRGLPGSGKSFVAKNIKSQESSYGSEAPRILALDDYFECDGEVRFFLVIFPV
jgi:hypothetical protein